MVEDQPTRGRRSSTFVCGMPNLDPFSRCGSEAILLPLFLLLGFALFELQRVYLLLFGAISLAASAYTYHAVKLVLPLWILGWLVFQRPLFENYGKTIKNICSVPAAFLHFSSFLACGWRSGEEWLEEHSIGLRTFRAGDSYGSSSTITTAIYFGCSVKWTRSGPIYSRGGNLELYRTPFHHFGDQPRICSFQAPCFYAFFFYWFCSTSTWRRNVRKRKHQPRDRLASCPQSSRALYALFV